MKKRFLILSLILVSIIALNAQSKKVRSTNNIFSLGAEISLPTGLFNDVYKFGLGASAQGGFPVSAKTFLTLNSGYISYLFKNNYGGGSEGFIPVLGGVEYNFSQIIFGSAQAGFTFYTAGGGQAFTYSPGVGFRLNKRFAALIKYTSKIKNALSSNAVGVRLSYNCGK